MLKLMNAQLNLFRQPDNRTAGQAEILATAKVNKLYRHYNNYKDVRIEIRRVNSQVRVYEVYNGRESCLTHSFVKSLFKNNRQINKRPFLEKENREFIKLLK